ncbi:hypothetical protein F2Q69_00035337 [Brassica cretica]|uniref:Aspartic peptidase DDI1-type domain-containing protein n=1 Tax=Brassica cretica TaxID=69181 RepID=A0A8S9SE60_BRACR|nr:hypothetical protein F2Q69_00035337 [Brassica cretica]
MFFRETKETEEDIRRMFHQVREKMKNRITLQKKSDPGKLAVPCLVKGIEFPHALCDTGASVNILPRIMADQLGLKEEPSKESFTFVHSSQRNSRGIVRDLEVQIGNALVPVDFHVLDIKLNWNSSLLLGRAFLSTVGAYSASIKTHTPTSIDDANQKSIDNHLKESIDSSSTAARDDWPPQCYLIFTLKAATSSQHLDEYDEDYEEERATEYRSIHTEEDRLLHHSYGMRNATLIDETIPTSIDTHHHHTNRRRASTDIAYYTSIDNEVDHAKEADHSIGSSADVHYHESYAVETAIHEPGADELHEGFTTEELFNHQERLDTDSLFAEACGRGTRFNRPFTRNKRPSIDNKASTSIDNRPKPTFIMANGAESLFVQERNTPEHQRRVTNKSYNTAGGVDDRFKPKYRQHNRPLIDIDVPTSIDKRSEDEHGNARGVDGHIIHVSKDDIRNFLERASMDENSYICLSEHERSFTQTKLIPEIYTKDEINEMLYGICGAQRKNEDDFQMKLDGVYYPLNYNISGLTTCLEDMRQDIARILDKRCDDIYFPWNNTISSLTSQTEAMQREIAEIQRYIASRPEVSTSIDRCINKLTDSYTETSIDEAMLGSKMVTTKLMSKSPQKSA